LTIPRDDKKIWKHYTDIKKNSGIKHKLKNWQNEQFYNQIWTTKGREQRPSSSQAIQNHSTYAQAIIQSTLITLSIIRPYFRVSNIVMLLPIPTKHTVYT